MCIRDSFIAVPIWQQWASTQRVKLTELSIQSRLDWRALNLRCASRDCLKITEHVTWRFDDVIPIGNQSSYCVHTVRAGRCLKSLSTENTQSTAGIVCQYFVPCLHADGLPLLATTAHRNSFSFSAPFPSLPRRFWIHPWLGNSPAVAVKHFERHVANHLTTVSDFQSFCKQWR